MKILVEKVSFRGVDFATRPLTHFDIMASFREFVMKQSPILDEHDDHIFAEDLQIKLHEEASK